MQISCNSNISIFILLCMSTNSITSEKTPIKEHVDLLRSKGFRITPIVTALLMRLCGTRQILTTSELKNTLSKTLGYDVGSPTVYRICERLASTGVLCCMHKSDGILRYFLCGNPLNKKHQHFICTRCLTVQEVACTLDDTIKKAVSHQIDGIVENNFIQLEGICRNCRK